MLGVSGAGVRSRRRRSAPGCGFRRRFRGGDRGLGGREAGLRRAAGRGAAGTDPAPRRGALVGRSASIDALYRVDLVRERHPAGRRASTCCCGSGGWAVRCALAGSREQVGTAGPRWQMDGVEPRGVGATRVALAGVLVCSTASCRRGCTIDLGALVRHSPAVPPTPCTHMSLAVVGLAHRATGGRRQPFLALLQRSRVACSC